MSDTDIPGAINGIPDDTPNGFSSLSSLKATHGELLQKRRDCGDTPEVLDQITTFIRRGRATGVLLDSNQDRRATQSLLDYWANILYRTGREAPDATLTEFDPALAPELDDDVCPYVGLDAFSETHREVFCGRQRLVEEMVARLQDERLLTVVGPSGSGKSSAVLAGLLPALKTGAVSGSQSWCYAPVIVPGSNPLANLTRLLWPSHGHAAAELFQSQIEHFRQDSGHLAHLVSTLIDRPVVLVIDQFEEVFTLCNDDQARQTFIDNLLSLLRTTDVRHTVIITMRIDFEPHVARQPAFHALFEKTQVRVTPLSAGELRETIEWPAKVVGLRFEEGVVDALLQDILGEPAALPLLQFTLLKLWENRERNRVTWEAYQRLGGGRQTLARSADEFYESLIPEEQVTAKRILLRMVHPGEGLEVTSNRVRREILYHAGEARDRIDRVLDKFIQARLVHLTKDDQPSDAQVEVAHEALVRNWPRLVDWLEDERENMRRRLRLTAAAEQWEMLGRDPEALWRGSLLEQALRFQSLNELEAEFVHASQEAVYAERKEEIARQRELARVQALAEAEQQRTRERSRTARILRRLAEEQARAAERESKATRRLRSQWRVLRVLLVALVVLFVFAVLAATSARESEELAATRAAEAVDAQGTAEAERDRAEKLLHLSTAHELASYADGHLVQDPDLRVLLAVEAVSITYMDDEFVIREAEDALRRAIRNIRVSRVQYPHDGVSGVAFSPNGSRLATSSGDGTVKVWNVNSGQAFPVLRGHAGGIRDVAFSPDGTCLATAGDDTTARVWNADSGQELFPLKGHDDKVYGVAFNPDGTRLATASWDDTVKVWDANSGQELATLDGHADNVLGVSFSPDGTLLATASSDWTAKVWNAETGRVWLTLWGHTAPVRGVAFSSDGSRLATCSADGTAKVWNVNSGQELFTLPAHTGPVLETTFFGAYLATASEDGTTKIWDTTSGSDQPLFTLPGYGSAIEDVTFSSDGAWLATASRDGTVKLWDDPIGETFIFFGHFEDINDIAFSPDGRYLTSADGDGKVRIWDVNSGREVRTIPSGHDRQHADIAFNLDGTRLVTTSEYETAKVWDFDSGQEQLTLPGHRGMAVAYSPNGTQVATVSEDGTARVWDAISGKELFPLDGHMGPVSDVAFSPDGKHLATAGDDGTVRVWDAATGDKLSPILDNDGKISTVVFSPDGTQVATVSQDGTARVWDAASGEELFPLEGHIGPVNDIAFSPDRKHLATANDDRMVRVWDATYGDELSVFSDFTDRVESIAFSPDGVYLAAASKDGTIRIYTVHIEELMEIACSRVTRNLTQNEWKKYLGEELEYHETCPGLPVPP